MLLAWLVTWAVTSFLGYGLMKGAMVNDWTHHKLYYFEADNVLIFFFSLAPLVAFFCGLLGQTIEHFLSGYQFRFCVITPPALKPRQQEQFLPNNLF